MREYIEAMTLEELTPKTKQVTSTEPTLTDKVVKAIASDVVEIAKNNGYLAIARKHAVPVRTVQKIHGLVKEVRAEKQAAIKEPEEDLGEREI